MRNNETVSWDFLFLENFLSLVLHEKTPQKTPLSSFNLLDFSFNLLYHHTGYIEHDNVFNYVHVRSVLRSLFMLQECPFEQSYESFWNKSFGEDQILVNVIPNSEIIVLLYSVNVLPPFAYKLATSNRRLGIYGRVIPAHILLLYSSGLTLINMAYLVAFNIWHGGWLATH